MRWSGLWVCGGLVLWMQLAQAQPVPVVPQHPAVVATPPICRTQPDSAACAAQTRHMLNRRLNQLYRLELQKVMGTYTERRLDHAQNLWRRWANAECLFRWGPPSRGGADWQRHQDQCLSAMIRARIVQLAGFVHCAGATCPPP